MFAKSNAGQPLYTFCDLFSFFALLAVVSGSLDIAIVPKRSRARSMHVQEEFFEFRFRLRQSIIGYHPAHTRLIRIISIKFFGGVRFA